MTKSFYALLVCFIFSSCEAPVDCQTQTPTKDKPAVVAQGCKVPTPIPEDPDTGSAIPNEAHHFAANISFTNFEKDDEVKVEKAIEIIKKIVGSQEFKDKVLTLRAWFRMTLNE